MEAINGFLELVDGTVDRLAHLSFHDVSQLLWFCLFFDFPRYLIPSCALFIQAILGARGLPPWPPAGPDQPLVSVLIPAYNEGNTIARTVRSIRESDYPSIEIIVVDDGSTDSTPEVGRSLEAAGKARFFRKEERGGKASSLNLALQVAHGEFIVCVDADSSLDRDAIRKILEPFRNPRVGAVSGNIKVRNRDTNLLTQLQACEYLVSISLGRRFLARANLLNIVSGAFGCFRRSALLDVGAWDPSVGDDADLSLKTCKLGLKIDFAPDAIAITDVPISLGQLFRQRRRWSQSFFNLRIGRHRNLFNPFVFGWTNFLSLIEGVFYLAVLLLALVVYVVFNAVYHPDDMAVIAVLCLVVYSFVSWACLGIAIFLSERDDKEWTLFTVAPLLVFYQLIMQAASVAALAHELFRPKARDPFYPEKVSRQVPRW